MLNDAVKSILKLGGCDITTLKEFNEVTLDSFSLSEDLPTIEKHEIKETLNESILKVVEEKIKEIAKDIVAKTSNVQMQEKKQILSFYQKEFFQWIKTYIKSVWDECTPNLKDIDLIGKKPNNINYDESKLNTIYLTLCRALDLKIKIPTINDDIISLLTIAKIENTKRDLKEYYIQFVVFYHYLTSTDQSYLKKLCDDKLKECDDFKKGNLKNLEKIFKTFNDALTNKKSTKRKKEASLKSSKKVKLGAD